MPLTLLLADRKLGAASKLAFLQLWQFAGRQPGRVVITADWLGSTLGRSPKAAWLWLDELEGHDLVKLGERNERRGTIVVDVYNPCPGGILRSAQNDGGQTRLPIGSGDITPAIGTAPALAKPVAHAGGNGSATAAPTHAEVCTPKPPSPLVPKKKENLSYQSTNASNASTNSMNSMSQALAAAVAIVDQVADPATQKDRLKRRIFSACGSATPVAEWVAGSAANLVVYHGVDVSELDRILGDVDAMREAGTLQHAGKFFHAKAKQLADRLGKPWPRPR